MRCSKCGAKLANADRVGKSSFVCTHCGGVTAEDAPDADRLTDVSERPPSNLQEVPPHLTIPASFGWTPATWGSYSLVCAYLVYTTLSGPQDQDANLVGGLALGGSLLLTWELYRRWTRTVFVHDGTKVVVYRKGKLSVANADLGIYVLDHRNSVGLAFVQVGLLVAGISFTTSDVGTIRVWGIATCAAAALQMGSSLYSRCFCYHYLVELPRGGRQFVAVHRDRALA